MKKQYLLYFSGLPGTGKTTLSKLLAAKLSKAIIIRRNAIKEWIQDFENTDEEERMMHDVMLRSASVCLANGYHVIIDSAGWSRRSYARFDRMSRRYRATMISIRLHCSADLSLTRTSLRPEKEYRWSRVRFERFQSTYEKIPIHIRVDSEKNDVNNCMKIIWRNIQMASR